MKKHYSLVTMVIAIFLIFNILSILLSAYYIKAEGNDNSLNYAKESMLEIVKGKSETISIKFDWLKTNTETIGALVEDALNNKDVSYSLPEDYVLNSDGNLTRKRNENKSEYAQSNVLTTADEITDNLIEELNITEVMDTPMESILENEDIIWGYIVTENNLLRVSPYLNLEKYFDDNHQQNEDIFYTMADEEHNPERNTVITKPYNDYLGEGWVVTCTHPIYDNNKMFGVACFDVSLSVMADELLSDFSLGDSGRMVWLSSSGNIYYHSTYSQSSDVQGEIFEKNIFEMDDIGDNEKSAFEKALLGGYGVTTYTDKEGRSQLMVYSQIENLDSCLVLQVAMNEFQPTLKVNVKRIWLIIAIEALLAFIFAWVLYNNLSKPMGRLVDRANRISAGDYSDYKDSDKPEKLEYYEIATLNEAFSKMSKNITLNILAEKELRQTEKMAGVGQLSAAIVHELKNVLARIKGALYILDMTKTSDINDEEIDTMKDAVKEAEDVIKALLDFSKEGSSQTAINAGLIINQILLLSNKDIISRNIRVKTDFDEDCLIYSDGIEALKVVLQNLILNAIQAVNKDGDISVSLYREGDMAIIKVSDNGPGISIEPIEKIFEPFVTTKENGSGIGLWITKRLTEGLGGKITAASGDGNTEFTVIIPTGEEEQHDKK